LTGWTNDSLPIDCYQGQAASSLNFAEGPAIARIGRGAVRPFGGSRDGAIGYSAAAAVAGVTAVAAAGDR
jgi:hypothetical protein